MKVEIAFDLDQTRKISWQNEFPKITKCKCGSEARLGFVAHEFDTKPNSGKFVCNLYKNEYDKEKAWLHDACVVAVYFCKKCLEPTALYNQA